MVWGACLLVVGLISSALFSGCETGFYRATRARWVLDGKSGDRFSRVLLWWANNPAVFVSNILIGNNLANYLVSLGIVMMVKAALAPDIPYLEITAAVLLSPIVFVYGESLPKYLFLQAPNRLLRPMVPLLVLANILFIPAVFILWVLGRLLEAVVGKSPERIRSRLARRELINMLQEGRTMGLLEPVQLTLAKSFFDMVDKSLEPLLIPLPRVISVRAGTTVAKALELASRHRLTSLPIADAAGRLQGYVMVEELLLKAPSEILTEGHPLGRIPQRTGLSQALIQLRSAGVEMALVVDEQELPRGLLSVQRLYEQLFAGTLARWKR